jgi:hypothetical protein
LLIENRRRSKEFTTMARTLTATVVSLDSHPARAVAERHAQLRIEAMRRHPAFQSRLRGASLSEDIDAVVIELRPDPATK